MLFFEIIFVCGRFQVKKKQFFHNFFPITLFGVVGVFISTSIITAGNFFTWLWWYELNFAGIFTDFPYYRFCRQLVCVSQVRFCWSDSSWLSWLVHELSLSIWFCEIWDSDLFWANLLTLWYEGVGTIFSSTDTVCTLQVGKIWIKNDFIE